MVIKNLSLYDVDAYFGFFKLKILLSVPMKLNKIQTNAKVIVHSSLNCLLLISLNQICFEHSNWKRNPRDHQGSRTLRPEEYKLHMKKKNSFFDGVIELFEL